MNPNDPDAKAAIIELTNKRFPLDIDGGTLLIICAQIQLALRHPANNGGSSIIAQRFVMDITEQITEEGSVLRKILDAGWDPAQDIYA